VVFSEDIAESNKIHFFERTKILVNVYGSGGQNIIYCPVNCINLTIISNQHLMNLKFIDVYGWTLNNGGGYRTAVLVGEGLGRIDQNWCPININLKEFENFLIQNI
jgi:capsular polysaccharide biosynthesis protein